MALSSLSKIAKVIKRDYRKSLKFMLITITESVTKLDNKMK